LTAY